MTRRNSDIGMFSTVYGWYEPVPEPPPPNQVLVALCNGMRMRAPTKGPNSVPAPPSAATMTICTEIRIPKPLSGSMKPVLMA